MDVVVHFAADRNQVCGKHSIQFRDSNLQAAVKSHSERHPSYEMTYRDHNGAARLQSVK